ncbi:eukaryotic-like serine/threonine-protein kinase [uncultured Gammaproteobacteria bacterium]
MTNDPDFLDALPLGHQILEYRLTAILGQGGFGITYRAEDQTLGHAVAIKEYLPGAVAVRDGVTVRSRSGAARDSFDWGRKRFLDEARTLAKFRHPNIVRVHRFFEANGTAYLVMDFEAGVSLAEYLRALGRLPSEAEIRAPLSPLLDGLAVVHGTGFLHRDIKPQNILLRPDGAPVLIDFGAARLALGTHSQMLTAIVTPGYAPFEQYFESGCQGPWSDIYALGAVLYRMITGSRPPDAPARVQGTDPCRSAVEAGRGRYSPALLAAIDWALKPRTGDRPQSLAEWRAALAEDLPAIPVTVRDRKTPEPPTEAIEPSPSPSPSPPAQAQPEPRPQSRPQSRFNLIHGLLILAAVGMLAAVLAPYLLNNFDLAREHVLLAKMDADARNEAMERLLAGNDGGSDNPVQGMPPSPPLKPIPPSARTKDTGGDYPSRYAGITTASSSCVGRLPPVEVVICGDARLARADGVMGQIYKELRAGVGGIDPEALRVDQRSWLKQRGQICPVTLADASLAITRDQKAECLLRITNDRINDLFRLLPP